MMRNEPEAMRELHAIRVKNFELTKDLSPEERSRLRAEHVQPIIDRYGFRVVSREARMHGTKNGKRGASK